MSPSVETATGKANLVFGFTLVGSMISRAWEVTVPFNPPQEEHPGSEKVEIKDMKGLEINS